MVLRHLQPVNFFQFISCKWAAPLSALTLQALMNKQVNLHYNK